MYGEFLTICDQEKSLRRGLVLNVAWSRDQKSSSNVGILSSVFLQYHYLFLFWVYLYFEYMSNALSLVTVEMLVVWKAPQMWI